MKEYPSKFAELMHLTIQLDNSLNPKQSKAFKRILDLINEINQDQ